MELSPQERLVVYHHRTGISQKKFAASIGVDRSKYSRIVAGKVVPDSAIIARISSKTDKFVRRAHWD